MFYWAEVNKSWVKARKQDKDKADKPNQQLGSLHICPLSRCRLFRDLSCMSPAASHFRSLALSLSPSVPLLRCCPCQILEKVASGGGSRDRREERKGGRWRGGFTIGLARAPSRPHPHPGLEIIHWMTMKQGAAATEDGCGIFNTTINLADQSGIVPNLPVVSPCKERNSANRQSDAQNGAIGSRLRRKEDDIVFPCCSSSSAPLARQQMHYAAYYQHVNIHLSFLC